jgi:hypothetical protein
MEPAIGDRPLDVLRHPEQALARPDQRGDLGDRVGTEHGLEAGRLDLQHAPAGIDPIGVAVDRAGHQPVGEAGDGAHHDAVAPAGHRVGGEGDAGDARPELALHDHRRPSADAIHPARLLVGRHVRGETGPPDPDRGRAHVLRRHVEQRQELAGMGSAAAILLARRGAHGERALAERRQRGVERGGGAGVQAVLVEGLRRQDDPGRHRRDRLQPCQRRRLAAHHGRIHGLAGVQHQTHARARASTGPKPTAR